MRVVVIVDSEAELDHVRAAAALIEQAIVDIFTIPPMRPVVTVEVQQEGFVL